MFLFGNNAEIPLSFKLWQPVGTSDYAFQRTRNQEEVLPWQIIMGKAGFLYTCEEAFRNMFGTQAIHLGIS